MFDFGGPVLLTPFELRHVGERALDLPAGTFAWTGPFDPSHDEDWRTFQSGGMNEREYWARRCEDFAAITGEPATMPSLCSYLYSGTIDEITRPSALRLIDDAHGAGLPVGILTNDLHSFHDESWLARMQPVIGRFDQMVEGRRDGVMKPDPRAYLLMAERLGVSPQECVFIDDQPGNLRGAEEVGMITVHLDPVDPEPAFAEARRLLGLA